MTEPIDIGAVGDFPEGGGVQIAGATLGVDYDVAVINDAGTLYAIDDLCTHSLASLAEGWVENGCVECPLHAAEFSLSTGAALSLPATKPVRTHLLEVRGDRVLLTPGVPRRAG